MGDFLCFLQACEAREYFIETNIPETQTCDERRGHNPGGGGTLVFLGVGGTWVCAARDSKLAPRSKKNFP